MESLFKHLGFLLVCVIMTGCILLYVFPALTTNVTRWNSFNLFVRRWRNKIKNLFSKYYNPNKQDYTNYITSIRENNFKEQGKKLKELSKEKDNNENG